MDKLKPSGIILRNVCLMKARIEMKNPDGKQEYNLQLIGLERLESDDGLKLGLYAFFDVLYGVENPLFQFTCDFLARYERDPEQENMQWKDFGSAVALAHIIPYLREFVSNMTNRLPVPVLMLNPINTHAMVENFEQRRKLAREAEQSSKTPSA